MVVPSRPLNSPQYWDSFFSSDIPVPFDSYFSYRPAVRTHVLGLNVGKSHAVVLGCGTSDVTQGLAEEGFEQVEKTDTM
jgi:hypothetical protein